MNFETQILIISIIALLVLSIGLIFIIRRFNNFINSQQELNDQYVNKVFTNLIEELKKTADKENSDE